MTTRQLAAGRDSGPVARVSLSMVLTTWAGVAVGLWWLWWMVATQLVSPTAEMAENPKRKAACIPEWAVRGITAPQWWLPPH